MLEELKKRVCDANLRLHSEGLVIRTWGNVSGADRENGQMVIKPSGLGYDRMRPRDMVVVSLVDGGVSEGELKPSSDTPTHLELYRAFPGIAGVVHTHSLYATAWAQARRDLLPFGTTHADYFHGPVPCTRPLTDEEVQSEYEANAGKVIAEKFQRLDPMRISAALVANHGPFTWGVSPEAAVEAAVMLEHLARLAILTTTIEPYPKAISRTILDKHYHRKHGPGAYYGQGGQKS